MPARCLNKVTLIGNLTRDPELRYTPSGSAVCSFGIATNRYWTTDTGEKKEDVQFHRIVAWTKLAEICSQLLGKGDKVYVEGRLQIRQWTGADGAPRTTTEIVISDMILLRSQRGRGGGFGTEESLEVVETPAKGALEVQAPVAEKSSTEDTGKTEGAGTELEKETVAKETKKGGEEEEKKSNTDETEGADVTEKKAKKSKKAKKEKSSETETESEDVEVPKDKIPF